MDITPLAKVGAKLIAGYGPGKFIINDQEIFNNIVLNSNYVEDLSVSNLEELRIEHILNYLSDIPNFILIGSGSSIHHLDDSITKYCREKGIGIDLMTTNAACRTYNVLTLESRNFIAILFKI